jgi:ABC-type multidrug transport system ATPase subunit
LTLTLAETERVTKQFRPVTAVDGVSLEVGEGEVVGLLGANGAGKTTVIRMLLGLLEPTAGGVRLFGRRPSRKTRARIGYVPQSLGLYEDLTVSENLGFAEAVFGSLRASLDEELSAVRGALIRELSLGIQRRVAFAEALAHKPRLLVLDEPTSGVDPLGRARLWETIRESAEAGAGVLVTTHHMEEAEHCDRLVVMAAGRVAATGTLEDIIGDARTVEVRGARWQDSYQALDAAGMPTALRGTTLRVPGGDIERVRAALRRAGLEASTRVVRATLEETFVALSEAA